MCEFAGFDVSHFLKAVVLFRPHNRLVSYLQPAVQLCAVSCDVGCSSLCSGSAAGCAARPATCGPAWCQAMLRAKARQSDEILKQCAVLCPKNIKT